MDYEKDKVDNRSALTQHNFYSRLRSARSNINQRRQQYVLQQQKQPTVRQSRESREMQQ